MYAACGAEESKNVRNRQEDEERHLQKINEVVLCELKVISQAALVLPNAHIKISIYILMQQNI